MSPPDDRRDDPSAPMVSFVVLNWHNEQATLDCVASIAAQTAEVSWEVIVVDNESGPRSCAALQGHDLSVIALDGNHGFTGGMNAGAAQARGRLIALLNNDTRLPETWLARAVEACAAADVAIVGGPTVDERGGGVGSTLPRLDPRGFSQLTTVAQPARDVATVDGSHLVVRARAWRELGGFDDAFFAYYEEADLCARALARGWRVRYEPELWVWHHRGLSSDRVRWRRIFWARRNRVVWVAKHFPDGLWRGAVLAAVGDYLREAVRGSDARPGSLRDELTRRSAPLIAALWIVGHGRRLTAARRATAAAGQRDPGYRDRLVRLYEPPPFAPLPGAREP